MAPHSPWVCDDIEGGEVTHHATQAAALQQAQLCIKALLQTGWDCMGLEEILVYEVTHRAQIIKEEDGFRVAMIPIAQWNSGLGQ